MNDSVFVEFEFLLLVIVSIILPACLYAFMMWKNAISRGTVLLLGFILIAIAGVNIFLLQRMSSMARTSPSLLDDRVFASEISVALYLLPALFAGIGANVISHILISHLTDAEKRFDQTHQ